MSKVEIKKLPTSRLEIKGAVPAEQFKSYRPKAVAHFSEKVKIDGFRPGKVPEAVLLEKIGESVILEEMAELALAEAYPKIILDNKIDALGRPEIKITKMAIGDDLAFTIETDVYPQIKLPEYEKLVKEVEVEKVEEVTEEEVTKVIEELKAHGQDKAEEYRDKIKHNLTHEKEWKAKDKYRLSIIKKLTAALETEVPKSLVEGELDKMLAELKGSIEQSGYPFADYLKQINKTEEELRGAWEEQAVERVKFGLFTNALAEQEQLYPTEEKIKEGVEELKKHYPEAAEARLRAYVASSLAGDAVWHKLEELAKK